MANKATPRTPSPARLAAKLAESLQQRIFNLDDVTTILDGPGETSDSLVDAVRAGWETTIATADNRAEMETRIQAGLSSPDLQKLVVKLSDAQSDEMMVNRVAGFELGLAIGRRFAGGAR